VFVLGYTIGFEGFFIGKALAVVAVAVVVVGGASLRTTLTLA
jgi:hypothetical protein